MQKPNLARRAASSLLDWGDTRSPDGGRRGRARRNQYERSLERPVHKPAHVAQPARYDMLRAPIYKPAPAAPMRAGADDHIRIASRGLRC